MANAQKTQSNDKTAGTKDTAQNNTASTETASKSTGSGSQISEQVGNIVSGDTSAVKDVLKQAKESTGQVASQAYGVAARKATSVLDEQKTNLAQGLTSVADNIRQLAESSKASEQPNPLTDITAKYSDSIASQVEKLSSYLEGKDLREMANDVERFARRNPAVFLGGAFTLGLLAARFLKSGNPNKSLMRRDRYEREGVYLPDESQGVHLPEDLDTQSTGSTGSQSNFSSGRSNTGTARSTGSDTTTGISGSTDFSSGTSGSQNKSTGTSGTANKTTGSSNTGG